MSSFLPEGVSSGVLFRTDTSVNGGPLEKVARVQTSHRSEAVRCHPYDAILSWRAIPRFTALVIAQDPANRVEPDSARGQRG